MQYHPDKNPGDVESEKKFKEVSVTMNYPSKKNYTKMRPVIDWLVIVYYWFLGYYDKVKI